MWAHLISFEYFNNLIRLYFVKYFKNYFFKKKLTQNYAVFILSYTVIHPRVIFMKKKSFEKSKIFLLQDDQDISSNILKYPYKTS